MAELRTVEGDVVLEDLLGEEDLEPEPGPAPKKQKGTKPLPPTDNQWEGRKRDCASKEPPMFLRAIIPHSKACHQEAYMT